MIYIDEAKLDNDMRIRIPKGIFKASGLRAGEKCSVACDSPDTGIYIYQDEPKPRENAGYTITKSIRVEGAEFVLGERPSLYLGELARKEYVTWEYSDTGGYFWGHYFRDEEAALEDFYRRAADECRARADRILDQIAARRGKA